jgi:uncharacterized protein YggE
MRTKTLFVTSILLLAALALSACSPTIAASPQTPVRTMSVTGTGQAYMTPDIAYIYIGVHTQNESASDAMTENNTQTQAVTSALKDFGIDPKDIRTTNFSIWPSQNYDQNGQPTSTVYMVDNTVYVTVRDLAKLGDLLDVTVKAGANSISSIQFDVADKTEALKKARSEAVKDAKQQAQELADAAGVKLGDIQTISFYDNIPAPITDAYGKGGGGGAAVEAAVPIQPGQMTLTVNVSMSYQIK